MLDTIFPIAHRLVARAAAEATRSPEQTLAAFASSTERQRSLVGATIALNVIGLVVVGARMFTRIRITHKFGVDDVFMLVAAVLSITYTVIISLAAKWGAGKHSLDVPMPDFMKFMDVIWFGAMNYTIGLMFVKLSILIFYTRLFPSVALRRCAWVLMFICFGYAIGSFFAILFQVLPVTRPSKMTKESKMTVNLNAYYYANASLNLFTDWAILLLPMYSLWTVQLPLRQRISLILLFALGSIPCVASVERIIVLKDTLTMKDATWNFSPLLMWSTTELNLAIICASAASLKPLLRRYAPVLIGSTTAHTSERPTGNRSASYPLSPLHSLAKGPRGGGGIVSQLSRKGDEDVGGVFNVEIAKTTEVFVSDDHAKSDTLTDDPQFVYDDKRSMYSEHKR